MKIINSNPFKNNHKNTIKDSFLFNFLFLLLIIIEFITESFVIKEFMYFMKPFVSIVLIFYFYTMTQIQMTNNEKMIGYALFSYLGETILSLISEIGYFIIIKYLFLTLSQILINKANNRTNIFIKEILVFIVFLVILNNLLKFEISINLTLILTLLFIFSFYKYEESDRKKCKLYDLMIKSQICFLFGEFLLALKILFFSDCTLLIPIRMMFYYVSQYNLVIKCVKEREINFK